MAEQQRTDSPGYFFGNALAGLKTQIERILATMKAAGLRVETDLRNEKINYKVREHSLAKVPVLVVVGKKEAETKGVALRRLGGQNQEILALAEATDRLAKEAAVPGT